MPRLPAGHFSSSFSALHGERAYQVNDNFDYRAMYRLMQNQRGKEQKLLSQAAMILGEQYVRLYERDRLFSKDEASWERDLCNNAMVSITELLDTFVETDQLVDECAMKSGETGLRLIIGGEGPC
jgi:hypothetical protein